MSPEEATAIVRPLLDSTSRVSVSHVIHLRIDRTNTAPDRPSQNKSIPAALRPTSDEESCRIEITPELQELPRKEFEKWLRAQIPDSWEVPDVEPPAP